MVEYTVEFKEEDVITCCNTCRFCGYGQWNGEAVCLASETLLYDINIMPHHCPLETRKGR